MSATHQARVRALFDRARALDVTARRALLDAECDDTTVRAEVEALLDAARDDAADEIARRIARAAQGTLATHALPERIGAYRIVGALGEGGMGMVWRGSRDDGEFTQTVAIKVIRGVASAQAIERLRRERQVLASLEHPGIARLIDGGTLDSGEPYLVMEYIHGEPLADWIARARPTTGARVALFTRLCEAVQFAHQRLVVHCDLKPANVMVRADGAPVLLDFGISRLIDPDSERARTATFAATPAYASPEQLLGQPVTAATDVFGLGMVLYEMLAGTVPARARDADSLSRELPAPRATAAARAEVSALFDARQLRGDLDAIVRRAVRVEAAHRYASVADLARDAQAWLDGRAVQAAGGHWAYLAGKFARRHRVGVALGAAAIAGLAILSLALVSQYRQALDARARAEREAQAASATASFLRELYTELDPSLHPGRAIDARELLDLGRARLDKLADTAPATRAALETTLADIYLQIGKPEPALELARAAEQRLDRDHDDPPTIVRADALLARALNAALDFKAARAAGDRALEGALRLGDRALEAPIRTARAWSALALGDTRAARIDYDSAEAYFKTQGEAAREPLARLSYNRAQLAEGEGDLEDALARYREAFRINEALQGRDHPITLLSQFGVGKIEIMLGRNREALTELSDLLERSRRVHGADTMASERAVAELGNAQREYGEPEAARASFDEALRITAVVNPGHETLQSANHLSNRAMIDEGRGDFDAALPALRESLAARLRLVGAESIFVGNARALLARTLLGAGQFDEAAEQSLEALRVRRAALPPTHENLIATQALQTEIAARRGRLNEATADRDTLDAALSRPLSPRARVQVQRALAALAQARGDHAARIAAIEAEIATMAATQNDHHPLTGWARLRLAQALLDAGREDAARAELDRARTIVEATHALNSPARAWLDELATRAR